MSSGLSIRFVLSKSVFLILVILDIISSCSLSRRAWRSDLQANFQFYVPWIYKCWQIKLTGSQSCKTGHRLLLWRIQRVPRDWSQPLDIQYNSQNHKPTYLLDCPLAMSDSFCFPSKPFLSTKLAPTLNKTSGSPALMKRKSDGGAFGGRAGIL